MPQVIYLGNPPQMDSLGKPNAQSLQSYPNAAPMMVTPSNFNPMDRTTWTQQILPYRYAWFHQSETAKTVDQNTLQNAGKTITDIVNQVEQIVLNQAPTLIVNAGLTQGVNLTVIGLAVDAGYEQLVEYQVIPGYHAPIPVTVYKIWYALYLVYDTTNNLPVASIPTGTLDSTLQTMSFVIPVIVLIVAVVVAGIVAAIVATELIDWYKSMTTKTDTTTLEGTITNPTNQPVTVQVPGDGTVTIPPGGTYTYKNTSTSTTPDLGGILTVGMVGIGLVAAGVFSYAILKGLQKPNYPPPPYR